MPKYKIIKTEKFIHGNVRVCLPTIYCSKISVIKAIRNIAKDYENPLATVTTTKESTTILFPTSRIIYTYEELNNG